MIEYSATAQAWYTAQREYDKAVTAVNTGYGKVSNLKSRACFSYSAYRSEETVADSVDATAEWLDEMTAMVEQAKAAGEALKALAAAGAEQVFLDEQAAAYERADAKRLAERAAEFEAKYSAGESVRFQKGNCYWLLAERTEDGGALLLRNNEGKRVSKRVNKRDLGLLLTAGVNNLHGMNDLAAMAA